MAQGAGADVPVELGVGELVPFGCKSLMGRSLRLQLPGPPRSRQVNGEGGCVPSPHPWADDPPTNG